MKTGITLIAIGFSFLFLSLFISVSDTNRTVEKQQHMIDSLDKKINEIGQIMADIEEDQYQRVPEYPATIIDVFPLEDYEIAVYSIKDMNGELFYFRDQYGLFSNGETIRPETQNYPKPLKPAIP